MQRLLGSGGEEAGTFPPSYHDAAPFSQQAVPDENRIPQLVRTTHATTFGEAPAAETRITCAFASEVQTVASLISNPKPKEYTLDDFKGNAGDYDRWSRQLSQLLAN